MMDGLTLCDNLRRKIDEIENRGKINEKYSAIISKCYGNSYIIRKSVAGYDYLRT